MLKATDKKLPKNSKMVYLFHLLSHFTSLFLNFLKYGR